MKTKQDALNWLNASIGQQYDFDGWYGMQCVDYANAYWNYVTGGRLACEGAKDIPFWNDFTGVGTVIKNDPKFIAQPGDIVVWNKDFGGGYGHVAVVLSATINQLVVVEQNWLNGGWTEGPKYGGRGWEVATKRAHPYETEMWFIRPKYSTSVIKKAVAKMKKPAAPSQALVKWKTDSKGNKYRSEKATFTCSVNVGIVTYYSGPSRKNKRAGLLKKGESVVYNTVYLADGHVWIKWKASNGKNVYMPIREHKNGIDGMAWGTFK